MRTLARTRDVREVLGASQVALGADARARKRAESIRGRRTTTMEATTATLMASGDHVQVKMLLPGTPRARLGLDTAW